METIDLDVEVRERIGKGAARAARQSGRLPAILYGPKRAPTPLTMDAKEFESRVGSLEGSHLLRLQSELEDVKGRLALVKEVQRDPVSRLPVHADLYEVDVNTKIRLNVPLHFVGRAQGVEMGGILQPIRRELEVLCLPTEIPEFIEVDVRRLEINEAIHASEVQPPPGVELLVDAEATLVTVMPPVVEEVKVAAGEGEVAAPAEGAAPVETPKAQDESKTS
jgi:large subunit ribosomal protein L25